MTPALRSTITRALTAGTVASLFSAAALMVCGRRETGSSAAPINAVSHWYWREEALYFRQTDIKHTLLGYLTHHGASVFWGALFAAALHGRPAARNPGAVLAGSMATSAAACFVDFQLTPERLTPGFEHRLSHRSLAAVYGSFAVGLAVGALLVGGNDPAK
ncbi:hypothetical protein DTW89_05215 [Acidovorax sp. BoFeN1]|nr:hypothetical protein DTW89_05215 [Acidovorax sp. BoFeN1]